MIKLWNRIDDRVDIARERICDLEGIAIKVLQNRKPKGRRERVSEARGQRQIASCPHTEVLGGGGGMDRTDTGINKRPETRPHPHALWPLQVASLPLPVPPSPPLVHAADLPPCPLMFLGSPLPAGLCRDALPVLTRLPGHFPASASRWCERSQHPPHSVWGCGQCYSPRGRNTCPPSLHIGSVIPVLSRVWQVVSQLFFVSKSYFCVKCLIFVKFVFCSSVTYFIGHFTKYMDGN